MTYLTDHAIEIFFTIAAIVIITIFAAVFFIEIDKKKNKPKNNNTMRISITIFEYNRLKSSKFFWLGILGVEVGNVTRNLFAYQNEFGKIGICILYVWFK